MKNAVFCIFSCLLLILLSSNTLAADKPFHIGPGDILEISVWKDPELSRKVIVPPDGVISFPLVNSINITNLAAEDLRKILAEKLSEFIPDVTVTVMLLEINSLRAYVIGKVNNPGEFPIDMETSVMQILSKAEGLNPFASQSNIKILRQQGQRIVKIPFDYGQVEKGKNLEQNIILQSGDVVVVP
jgi:polysaccharide export outer membrane protein